MTSRNILIFCLCCFLSQNLHARLWRNTDGSKTFQGDFISFNGEKVEIENLNGKVLTFPITKLHEEDQKWIKTFANKKKEEKEKAARNSVFAGLNFGDSKDTVIKKLKSSPLIVNEMDEHLLSRTGINGLFHTKSTIGSNRCSLFFDWNGQSGLSEVSIRSKEFSEDHYDSDIQSTWKEMSKVVSSIFGKPLQSGTFPLMRSLTEGIAINTHIWRIRGGGSALVGVGMQNGKYMATITFTHAVISPAR